MDGTYIMHGRDEKYIQNSGLKTSFGRPRYKYDVKIKMGLKETEWEGVLDSSGSGQGLVVAGFCEHSNTPSDSKKDREFFD